MKAPAAKILIVDDEPIKRSVMEDELRDAGYLVAAATNPFEAQEHLAQHSFDVVLTDLRMPGRDGMTFLRSLNGAHPAQAVIVMTAYGTVETAVEAMKLGAFDYIQKPFSTQELLLKLDRLLRYEGLSRENEALRSALLLKPGETRFIGDPTVARDILSQVHAVSGTDCNVVIRGESGTGKELIAWLIHETSFQALKPFVAVS